MRPLEGIRVLDFTTLLPGPLCTLMLAEAGAEVIKIERPGRGDEMRSYVPKLGEDSVNFALLNRGKRSVAVDLKAPGAVERLRPLVESADVIIEQFRPGVMDRLGLGYAALSALQPRLVYCSLTGYGQTGPRSGVAAHDLNFAAESGLLAIAAGSDGAPVVPAALVADIGGGSFPAVINILLALQQRERTGQGCHLDVAMSDNLFTFMYWGLGNGFAAGRWPRPGAELVSGGSPRYQVYRTADDRFVAAAPLEDQFWKRFCELVDLPERWRDDALDPAGTRRAVAERIRSATAEVWRARFAGQDVCCAIVASLEEAVEDPHVRARGLFDRSMTADGRRIPALPLPLAPQFRSRDADGTYPALGEANALLDR
jgi:crotonobetainyl-CoA:carnitine CoA-transferase CaiB-like acyl-CoA transferase